MPIVKLGVWYAVRLVVGFIGASFYGVVSHAEKFTLWQAGAMVILAGAPTVIAINVGDLFEENLTRNWSPPWEIAAAKVDTGRSVVEFMVSALFVLPVAALTTYLGLALPQRPIIFETTTAWFMWSWAIMMICSCVKFRPALGSLTLFP